jgi:predicted nucleic acid-binding protein
MTLVLDASMAVAWIFAAERKPSPREVLRRVVAEGASVPSIWRLEVASALQTAIRRKRCDEGYADRSLERLSRLPIATDTETDKHAWTATLGLARSYDLTAYDAAYLELAMRLSQPLASCDKALIKAAKRSAVAVLGA